MSLSFLLQGVRVLGAPAAAKGCAARPGKTSGVVHGADLLIRDGVVAAVGKVGAAAAKGAEVVDADGLVALPGLVDLHTHLREPGREDAETVDSGSRAAALGGYTAVCAMANTSPVADTAGVVEQVWRLGHEAGLVEVRPVGAVTVGLAGQRLAELGAMADSAARVRMFSDDGHCVHDPRLMRRALEYVKAFDGVIAQHAEEPRLTEDAQMHEGIVSGELGLPGWPAVAEEAIVARDVLLAEHVGARLHVCHVSTAGSVEILRWAKRRGIRVTAEVTPHHLLLTDECVRGRSELASPALADQRVGAGAYDPLFKVNPPLRTRADVDALRAALVEGVIDAVATDHAPHAVQDKECEWSYARPGMLGLETALSIVVTAMQDELGWDGIAERMSRTPARIAGLPGHGHGPVKGAPANLTLVDPTARWTVDPALLASRSRNTPYAGLELTSRVVATFFQGVPTVLDGKAVR
jgi:dihydroorotase